MSEPCAVPSWSPSAVRVLRAGIGAFACVLLPAASWLDGSVAFDADETPDRRNPTLLAGHAAPGASSLLAKGLGIAGAGYGSEAIGLVQVREGRRPVRKHARKFASLRAAPLQDVVRLPRPARLRPTKLRAALLPNGHRLRFGRLLRRRSVRGDARHLRALFIPDIGTLLRRIVGRRPQRLRSLRLCGFS